MVESFFVVVVFNFQRATGRRENDFESHTPVQKMAVTRLCQPPLESEEVLVSPYCRETLLEERVLAAAGAPL